MQFRNARSSRSGRICRPSAVPMAEPPTGTRRGCADVAQTWSRRSVAGSTYGHVQSTPLDNNTVRPCGRQVGPSERLPLPHEVAAGTLLRIPISKKLRSRLPDPLHVLKYRTQVLPQARHGAVQVTRLKAVNNLRVLLNESRNRPRCRETHPTDPVQMRLRRVDGGPGTLMSARAQQFAVESLVKEKETLDVTSPIRFPLLIENLP